MSDITFNYASVPTYNYSMSISGIPMTSYSYDYTHEQQTSANSSFDAYTAILSNSGTNP